jgi:hypothetical protein
MLRNEDDRTREREERKYEQRMKALEAKKLERAKAYTIAS